MTTQEAIQLREERAADLLADNRYHIGYIDGGLYRVEHPHEETGEWCSYVVDSFRPSCTCPDGVTRRELHLGLCKHAIAVLELVARLDASFYGMPEENGPEAAPVLPLTIYPWNDDNPDPGAISCHSTLFTRLTREEVDLRLPPGIDYRTEPGPKGISRERYQAGYKLKVIALTIGKEKDFVFEALEVQP